MKNLIEISKIVTKKKVRKIEIFDDYSLRNKNSKFNEFYEALQADKFKNDLDAARYLYGCSPTDDKYRQLKSRFRKRLLNTLFFLDVNLPAASNYERAYFSCNKDWTLVKILISNEAEMTASSLARQILTTALKFKFADVIVNCSRILRLHCSQIGDEKGFEVYDQHIKQYANILDAEIRSEEMYQRVVMDYYKPPSQTEGLLERIDTCSDALVGLSEIYKSPIIDYHMYLVWVLRYEIIYDYERVLKICDQAQVYMAENPQYYQESKLIFFHQKRISAYLHLQDFNNGKASVEKPLKLFRDGSEPWYKFMEYYFLLALHTDQYVTASAVFQTATGNSHFRKLPTQTRDKWRIFEVYLNYIIEAFAKEKPNLASQPRKTFRINAFLVDPILFPKEQRIFTVHMVVAQILFLLERRKFKEINDRIDRLRSYANRQLNKETNYRTIQFIRLLQQLSRAEFMVNNLSNTDKYYNRLIETPMFYRGQSHELEVIPYDKLWNHIIHTLMIRRP
ncbi:MAG: hypothetical protein KDC34_15925 [Saprospiraceae bacterium]|nr:hypothetical protein [Saprospiraceae bacterium]